MAGIFGPTSPADDFTVDSFGVRGPVGPCPLGPLGPWTAGAAYVAGPPASYVSQGVASYACTVDHTAGVFADDLAAGRWALVVQAFTQEALNAAATAALAALIAGLSQALPPTVGVLWNDGGSLSIS
ncbi:MAG: hypothetical protein ACRYGP_13890 [Janthinobacterium lividum]